MDKNTQIIDKKSQTEKHSHQCEKAFAAEYLSTPRTIMITVTIMIL